MFSSGVGKIEGHMYPTENKKRAACILWPTKQLSVKRYHFTFSSQSNKLFLSIDSTHSRPSSTFPHESCLSIGWEDLNYEWEPTNGVAGPWPSLVFRHNPWKCRGVQKTGWEGCLAEEDFFQSFFSSENECEILKECFQAVLAFLFSTVPDMNEISISNLHNNELRAGFSQFLLSEWWPIGRSAKSPAELQDGTSTVIIFKISFKYIKKGDVGMTVSV